MLGSSFPDYSRQLSMCLKLFKELDLELRRQALEGRLLTSEHGTGLGNLLPSPDMATTMAEN